MVRVGVFGGFLQLAVRREHVFKRFFGVPTELIMIVGAGRFGFLPCSREVMLRRRQMRMQLAVDVLYGPLCHCDASQNQHRRESSAPQEIRFHL